MINKSLVALLIATFLPTGFALAQASKEKESRDYFERWLNEDVVYIITPEEREIFSKLQTPEEKERFIEQFWRRRDPDPSTPENEFKIEHYRRIQYANDHFTSGIPGWKTHRGMIYIKFGPPDEIEDHPGGSTYVRPRHEGGGRTIVHPFQIWRYRHIPGIGDDIEIEFVDKYGGNLYRIASDEMEKDALLYIPGIGLTRSEELGFSDKKQRIANRFFADIDQKYEGQIGRTFRAKDQPFERLTTLGRLDRPPEIKFKDLQAVVTSRITYNQLPFDLRTDLVRYGADQVLVPLTIKLNNEALSFKSDLPGLKRATLNLYAQVETLGRQVVYQFEDTVVRDLRAEDPTSGISLYQRNLPLKPGRYKLSVVLKDVNSGHIGTLEKSIYVPEAGPTALTTSTLILAEAIRPALSGESPPDPFIMQGFKVYPSVDQTFVRDSDIGLYLEVYNLSLDQATKRPAVEIKLDIYRDGRAIILPERAGAQSDGLPSIAFKENKLIIADRIPLKGLAPGEYQLALQIRDKIAGAQATAKTNFRIVERKLAQTDADRRVPSP